MLCVQTNQLGVLRLYNCDYLNYFSENKGAVDLFYAHFIVHKESVKYTNIIKEKVLQYTKCESIETTIYNITLKEPKC